MRPGIFQNDQKVGNVITQIEKDVESLSRLLAASSRTASPVDLAARTAITRLAAGVLVDLRRIADALEKIASATRP